MNDSFGMKITLKNSILFIIGVFLAFITIFFDLWMLVEIFIILDSAGDLLFIIFSYDDLKKVVFELFPIMFFGGFIAINLGEFSISCLQNELRYGDLFIFEFQKVLLIFSIIFWFTIIKEELFIRKNS